MIIVIAIAINISVAMAAQTASERVVIIPSELLVGQKVDSQDPVCV